MIFILILSFSITSCNNSDFPQGVTCEVNTSGPFQFAFHYEKEEPEFEFVSPSGKVYNKDSNVLTIEKAEQPGGFNSIYYLFSSGEVGKWKIKYNKFSNKEIQLYYSEG